MTLAVNMQPGEELFLRVKTTPGLFWGHPHLLPLDYEEKEKLLKVTEERQSPFVLTFALRCILSTQWKSANVLFKYTSEPSGRGCAVFTVANVRFGHAMFMVYHDMHVAVNSIFKNRRAVVERLVAVCALEALLVHVCISAKLLERAQLVGRVTGDVLAAQAAYAKGHAGF